MKKRNASLITLFKWTTTFDHILMATGIICGMLTGLGMPVVNLLLGSIITIISSYVISENPSAELFWQELTTSLLHLALLGLFIFISAYIMMAALGWTSARQCRRWRSAFFSSILLQKEIAFFDEITPATLASRSNADFVLIEAAISDKLGLIAFYFATFLSGFSIAFYRCWQLTLVVAIIFPVMGVSGALFTAFITRFSERAQQRYAEANRLATETLLGIRTVAALRAESTQISAYKAEVERAAAQNTKGHLFSAASLGFIWMLIFFGYALAFYTAAQMIVSGTIVERGTAVSVFFCVVMAAFGIGHAFPHIATVAKGATAASTLYELLAHPTLSSNTKEEPTKSPKKKESTSNEMDKSRGIPISQDQNSSPVGLAMPKTSLGTAEVCSMIAAYGITFHNVGFKYKSRPDAPVLNSVSIAVKPGKTTAIVGCSGAGKSTIVQLLQRFYDPTAGTITIGDETSLVSIPPPALRSAIGVVSQETVLFDDTIFSNVALGATDTSIDAGHISNHLDTDGVTPRVHTLQERVVAACRLANAHTFIIGLPDGYETRVGTHSSSLLSGGQRQRIAIARAIIRDPALLILDEATAALDASAEAAVHDALATASQGRTILVIAHRLATVRAADNIIVMDQGRVVQQGTHDELMAAKDSLYVSLVSAQTSSSILHPTNNRTEVLRTPDLLFDEPIPCTKNENLFLVNTSTKGATTPVHRLIRRVLQMQRPETLHFLFGLICAIGNGLGMPVLAILFASIQTVFVESSVESLIQSIGWLALLLCFQGLVAFGCQTGQLGLFGIAGERLASRLRVRCFAAMLVRPMASFDQPGEDGAALSARLATDPDALKGLTGPLLGTILQTTTTISIGLVFAFTSSPSLALTLLTLCTPLMVISGYLQMKMLTHTGLLLRDHFIRSQSILLEAFTSRRAVASINGEHWFIDRYEAALDVPFRISLQRAFVANAISFSLGQAMLAWSYAIAFYHGSKLLLQGLIDYRAMNGVLYPIIFSAMAAGQVASFLPDLSAAKLGAHAIFSLLDTTSTLDSENKTLSDISSTRRIPIEAIQFENVCFSYPSRPTMRVIDNLSLRLEIGKRIAIVGPSGSGKSSLFSLLECFYAPQTGTISIDGQDIASIPAESLRNIFGLVSQDPILFSRTISQNIALGLCGEKQHNDAQTNNDDRYEADECQAVAIENAAIMAGIHSEILASFQNGYETQVGEHGSMLSGGQRQRIAIARAIVSNPPVLLFDEATSALDSQAELKIQKAIKDYASSTTSLVPRTVIVIAHRLSTVRDFDQIIVMDKGRVVESGTHDQLMALKDGLYVDLVQHQERLSN